MSKHQELKLIWKNIVFSLFNTQEIHGYITAIKLETTATITSSWANISIKVDFSLCHG